MFSWSFSSLKTCSRQLPDNFLFLAPVFQRMKQAIKFLLLCVLSISLLQAGGQVKKNKKPVKEEVEAPPPPQIEMSPVTDSVRRQLIQESLWEGLPVPQVDFDTTASPADDFTKNILKLLQVTNGINMGVAFAENMPRESENNEMLKEFYSRLIQDMQSGTGRRWLERMYVREYRKRFTNEEVEELIKFYESPVGKKLVSQTMELLPVLMQEGKTMGMYLGVKLYSEILKEKDKN